MYEEANNQIFTFDIFVILILIAGYLVYISIVRNVNILLI